VAQRVGRGIALLFHDCGTHFLTVSLIADKQQIMEGYVMLKAQSEQIYRKYEYLPMLSVSMLDSFRSLKAVL